MEGVQLVPRLNSNLNRIILRYIGPEEYYNSVQYVNHSMFNVKNVPELMSGIFTMYQPLVFDYDHPSKTLRYFTPSVGCWDAKEVEVPANFPETEHAFIHTPENMVFCFDRRPPNSIYVYNPITNAFRKVAELANKRKDFGLIRAGKTIYVIGRITLECEKFDYIKRKVEPMAPAKIPAISFALCQWDEEFIYRFTLPQEGYMSGTHRADNILERYSIFEDKWEVIIVHQMGPYKPIIGSACISKDDGEILILGRVLNAIGCYAYKPDVNGGEFRALASPTNLYPDAYYPWRETVKDQATGSFFVLGATRVLSYNPVNGEFFGYAS